MGHGNALYLMETGEPIDARRTYAMGLVQEVVPSGRAVERAMELAERIASYPQRSLLADRRAALESWSLSLEEGLALEADLGLEAARDGEMAEGARSFFHRKG